MNTNKTDDALLARATVLVGIVEALKKLPPELRKGEAIGALVVRLRSVSGDLVTARQAEQKVLASRDAIRRELRTLLTRIHAGVKGAYGPDSDEYGQVGGVRTSDRKPPKHKRATTEATKSPA